MGKDLSIDFDVWDLKDAFSCLEAAYLWCEIDPDKVDEDDYENFNQSLKDQLKKKTVLFELAAQERKLIYDDEITMRDARRIRCAPRPKYKRESFISLAGRFGQRPLFLFKEDREKESGDKQAQFKYSPDFRSIALPDGKAFTLTTQQAQVIELLHTAYENGTPDISGEFIFDSLGTEKAEQNLKKAVFKNDKDIYDTLIESTRKGTYRLKVK